jgi:two-component system sensor histidine kinase KdpD
VGSAIRAAQHALGGTPVQTDVPADLPLVEFDAALMERVLVNLLENAAKYGRSPGPPPPPIVVSARVTPTQLLISVRDHGPGLPADSLGREQALFEKFSRGKSESATPGVGLGLAICKAVVQAHQGTITASQALGGGAEFTLTLPRRCPPALPDPAER